MATNPSDVFCRACPARILRPHVAAAGIRPAIPGLSAAPPSAPTAAFWVLPSPLAFENVAVSSETRAGRRYLACADCAHGPFGYTVSPAEYLVDVSRVRYALE